MCSGIMMKSRKIKNVTIGCCTFRRHEDLRALLASIVEIKVDESINLSVLIIDNDTTPSAQDLVKAANFDSPWDIHYVHEPKPGIPFARNRAVLEAGTEGFLIFVDDDETVAPNWVQELVDVQAQTDATFVQGPVEMTVQSPDQEWWLSSTFFRQNSFRNLAPLVESWSNNVMIDLKFVHRNSVKFDPTLQYDGGTDTLFFQDIVAKGGRGYFADKAVVYEIQRDNRLKWKWCIMRQYRYGITRANTVLLRRSIGVAGTYCIIRGGGMLTIGLLKLPIALFRGRIGLANSLALLARGAGVISGLLGGYRQEYKR